MTTSNGRGRPPYMHNQIRDGRYEPGDEITGAWPPEQLLRMNDRFVERLERAFARGLETRPQETEDEAHQRREHTAQMNGGSPICTRCGTRSSRFAAAISKNIARAAAGSSPISNAARWRRVHDLD